MLSELGRGLISSGPETCRGESDGSQEVASELVEASGDASEMLEFAEEALDQIALAVDASVDGSMDETLACRWDVGPGAAGSDQLEQRVGIITAVGDDVAALQAGQQVWRRAQVVGLAGGQHEPYRQTVLIDEHVDLGAQSATRTADGVILAPFLPPAAC